MAFSTYRVYFQNQKGQIENLDYELFDSPIVAKWIATQSHAYEHGLPLNSQSFHLKPSPLVGETTFNQLQEELKKIEREGHLPLKPLRVQRPEELDQVLLNHLFDEIQEDTSGSTTRLRDLIQQMENFLNCSNIDQFFNQSVTYSYAFEKFLPVRKEDYEWFSGENLFGDLLLGYGRMGKSLDQCYLTQHKSWIQRGLVRPQRTISTQVILNFPSKNPSPGDWTKFQSEVMAWFRKFNLKKLGYDPKDPAYAQFGNPKLGTLKQRMSSESVFRFLSEYQTVLKTELLN